MTRSWSHRLLTLLQLTRMALVFTAIADAWCGLALWAAAKDPASGVGLFDTGGFASSWPDLIEPWRLLLLACVSVGLYGFGMSLNDIIDRRRDRQISPGRPLPSGRVSIAGAQVICFFLLALAAGAGALHRAWGGPDFALWLVAITLALIWFYDAAGKYLVGPGLLALGLVRFFQCMVPALSAAPPYHPLLWHPLWLLNHVAILSAVCYRWEEKRPSLTARHWIGVVTSLLVIDAVAIWAVGTELGRNPDALGLPALGHLLLDGRLLGPVAASLLFVAIASRVRRAAPTRREAGQATMLYGLLWLIVYDAVFAGLYAHWLAGAGLLMLLPVAYLSVRVMRGWSKLMAASQAPEFRRAVK